MICGMLSIGEKIPERSMAGRIKKKAVIIACCCVREMVDIKRPKLNVVRMKRKETPKRKKRFPLTGTLKTNLPTRITRAISAIPIRAKGTVLPMMSSHGFKGETMSCSRVPISLSLVMAIEVRMSVVRRRIRHMTPGTI